jgi:hypothetical protein
VAVVDDGLGFGVGQRPGDRHRLRRLEAQVKTGHGRCTSRSLRDSADWLATYRVRQRHQHQLEVLFCHLRAGLDAFAAGKIGEAATPRNRAGGVPDSA